MFDALENTWEMQRLHKNNIVSVVFTFGAASASVSESRLKWYGMVLNKKSELHAVWKSVNKIERKSYIYLLFPPLCGFLFDIVANGIKMYSDLTPIPWWLRTYFSLLPAMNFNESLSTANFCHVVFSICVSSTHRVLDRIILVVFSRVLIVAEWRKKKSPNKIAELRASEARQRRRVFVRYHLPKWKDEVG